MNTIEGNILSGREISDLLHMSHVIRTRHLVLCPSTELRHYNHPQKNVKKGGEIRSDGWITSVQYDTTLPETRLNMDLLHKQFVCIDAPWYGNECMKTPEENWC